MNGFSPKTYEEFNSQSTDDKLTCLFVATTEIKDSLKAHLHHHDKWLWFGLSSFVALSIAIITILFSKG